MPWSRAWPGPLILAMCALVAIAVTTSADQTATRFTEGTVTDQKERPIEGAVVQLKDLVTLQIRSYITSADGRYHFGGLGRNIDYELVARYDGRRSATRLLSRFDSRTEPVIDLEIRLSQ